MKKRSRLIPAFMLLSGTAMVLLACGTASTTAPAPQATPTPPPPVMPINKDSWILVDLPPDATQLDHGAEIYRLVCSACHAHSGEGLTDAWRATWDPKDQNCWQSKCHAVNHPPDGFVLPIAPAVVGRRALAPFQTAADLRAYIQARMPWQEPNSLTEEEGWAVTAYVIKLNRMNPPALNADTAVQFRLHPEAGASTPVAVQNTPSSSPSAVQILAAAALIALCIYLVIRIRRQVSASKER